MNPSTFPNMYYANGVCTGSETVLSSCPGTEKNASACPVTNEAWVVCTQDFGTGNAIARLADGGDANSGRLEVFTNNAWGTVCNKGFDNNDAVVACFTMGLPSTQVCT